MSTGHVPGGDLGTRRLGALHVHFHGRTERAADQCNEKPHRDQLAHQLFKNVRRRTSASLIISAAKLRLGAKTAILSISMITSFMI